MPFTAHKNDHCAICLHPIVVGDITRPISNQNPQGGGLLWSHMCCVDPHDPRIPICKHWNVRGTCVYLDTCLFRHPIDLKQAVIAVRKRHGSRQRLRVANDGRAGTLRRWLIKVFGIEYLQSGSGILDVAGGKGEVSFEFVNLNGVQSTVLDPRPIELNRFIRKLGFGFYHRNDVLGSFNTLPKPPEEEPSLVPRHMRVFFEMDGIGSRKSAAPDPIDDEGNEESESKIYGDGDCDDGSGSGAGPPDPLYFRPLVLESALTFQSGLQRGFRINWTLKGLVHEDDVEGGDVDEGMDLNIPCVDRPRGGDEVDGGDCKQTSRAKESEQEHGQEREKWAEVELEGEMRRLIRDGEDAEVRDVNLARALVDKCSVVIGMHPDQAAEHILEYAIRNNKPCAFVPCCVYGRSFPLRRGSNGQPVRNYGELVEYLLGKMSMCFQCKGSADSPPPHPPSPHPLPFDVLMSRFGAVELDFDGKNILIYYMGEREPLSDPCEGLAHVARGPAGPEHWWRLSDGPKTRGSEAAAFCKGGEHPVVPAAASHASSSATSL